MYGAGHYVLAAARVPERLAVAHEAPGVLVTVGARLVRVLLLLDHENAHYDVAPGLELPVASRLLALRSNTDAHFN